MDSPRAIRTFWALELGAAPRRRAAALALALREGPGGDDVRWTREESLHVTLRFLGRTDPDRVPDLVREVNAALRSTAPFALRLAALHLFPSPQRPRVVVLGLEPAAPLLALAAGVEHGVVAAGFPAEPRAFRPHLTLGRARRGRRPRLEGVTASVTAPSDTHSMETWDVVETVLLRSDPRPDGGTRYTPLERVPLGAPSGSLHP